MSALLQLLVDLHSKLLICNLAFYVLQWQALFMITMRFCCASLILYLILIFFYLCLIYLLVIFTMRF